MLTNKRFGKAAAIALALAAAFLIATLCFGRHYLTLRDQSGNLYARYPMEEGGTFAVTFIFDHLLAAPCLWYVLITTACALVIGIFAIIKHKDNIKRLKNGEEKKIHAKKST